MVVVEWARGWVGEPYLDGGVPVMDVVARADDGGAETMRAWARLPAHPNVLQAVSVVEDGMRVVYADLVPAEPESDAQARQWVARLVEVFWLVAEARDEDRWLLSAPVIAKHRTGHLLVAFLPPQGEARAMDDAVLVEAWRRAVNETWDGIRLPEATTLLDLTRHYTGRGKSEEELEVLRRYDRGHGFERMGRWMEALDAYERAMGLDESIIASVRVKELVSPSARVRWWLRRGRAHDALALARTMEGRDGHWLEAAALVKLERHADAVGVLDGMLDETPGDVGAIYARAKSLFHVKRYVEAREGFERVIALEPARLEALLLRREVDRAMRAVRAEVGEQPAMATEVTDLYDDLLAHVEGRA